MALEQLNATLIELSKTVGEFNVGAVSIQDYKPLEEQIKDMRQILKIHRAHSALVNAKHKADSIKEKPQEDISATISHLNEKIALLQNANSIIMLSLHSCSTNDIMFNNKPTPEIKKQVQGCMRKLFSLNDNLMSLHQSMIKALETELELKISYPQSMCDYQEFLEEQEAIRDTNLQETNPELSQNKNRVRKKLIRINLMKRLMKSMIASSNEMVLKKPFLYEMMEKHRELVNIETIIEMARDEDASNSS